MTSSVYILYGTEFGLRLEPYYNERGTSGGLWPSRCMYSIAVVPRHTCRGRHHDSIAVSLAEPPVLVRTRNN